MTGGHPLRGTVGAAVLITLTLAMAGCGSTADPVEVAPNGSASASSSASASAEPSAEPSADPTPDPASTENALLDCIQGTWNEDMVNLAAQLPAMPSFELTSVEGTNTLTIDGDSLTYTVDYVSVLSPTIESPIHGQGITRGATTHTFTLGDGTTDIFFSSAISTDVAVELTLFTGDEASEPQQIPWDGGFGDSGFVTCTGDAMTIDPDSSGRIHLFTR